MQRAQQRTSSTNATSGGGVSCRVGLGFELLHRACVCGVSNAVMWIWDRTKPWITKQIAESVVFVPADCIFVLLEKFTPGSTFPSGAMKGHLS